MMRPADLSRWLGTQSESVLSHVRAAEERIVAVAGQLDPLEAEGIAGATPTRVSEFKAGRCLARGLLRDLGALDPVVMRARDRSPVWPIGFVGSIAHTDTTCLVAVARSPLVESIGVDIEPSEPLEDDLFGEIATRRELNWLAGAPAEQRGRHARRLFAAKEAVYKCLYPIDREFLGFHDVEVEFTDAIAIDPRAADDANLRISDASVDGGERPGSRTRLASFRVRCDVSPSGVDARLVGWTVEADGLIRAFACVPAPASRAG